MQIFHRLHLLRLLLRPRCRNPNGFHIAELSTPLLLALSKPGHPHQIIFNDINLFPSSLIKTSAWSFVLKILNIETAENSSIIKFTLNIFNPIIKNYLVEVGGIEPPSRTHFSLLHTTISILVPNQHVPKFYHKCNRNKSKLYLSQLLVILLESLTDLLSTT